MASVAYNGQAYVYNITQGINYPASGTDGTNALVLAMRAALDNDILIVYKDHTCTGSAVIRYNNISIKAAPNTNPIVTWIAAHKENMTGSNSFEAMGANPVTNIDTKTCIFINSGKTISFGETNSTGVLTLKGSPTLYGRIIKSYGTINLYDGIIITGGNTGGGTYSDSKTQWNGNPILETNTKPNKGNEITYGQNGFGSGIFISGENIELNMYGGQIIDNYSLWGASTSDTGHNYTGGGGGVFLASGVTMNMYGGSITHNAAGSGGGGGILVGSGAELVISGGTISENISNFASGGGIGVQIQNKGITITGGTIADNKVAGSGGGIFARGDSRSITITGGIFENNIADNGGAILFWTVSDDLEKNKLIIGGNTILRNNHANRGGAIYIGRETAKAGDGTTYALGQIIQLLISDDADIYNNSASENGGAVYIQTYDNQNTNIVDISGGNIHENSAQDGAGIYISKYSVNNGGTDGVTNVTINDATFQNNNASGNGGGMYIADGHIIITNGMFDSNTASYNGGAIYVGGGDFSIISGNLTNNTAVEYGGAVYVNNGNITIGVEGCEYTKEDEYHTIEPYTHLKHPSIKDNISTYGGAFFISGSNTNVIIHCGTIDNNFAYQNGNNVYLEDGILNYYDGAIGMPHDAGFIILGGSFNDLSGETDSGATYEVHYHSSMLPTNENNELIYNAKIPVSKWGTSPKGNDLLKEDSDTSSPTWADVFAEHIFMGWQNDPTEEKSNEIVNLYAIWKDR